MKWFLNFSFKVYFWRICWNFLSVWKSNCRKKLNLFFLQLLFINNLHLKSFFYKKTFIDIAQLLGICFWLGVKHAALTPTSLLVDHFNF